MNGGGGDDPQQQRGRTGFDPQQRQQTTLTPIATTSPTYLTTSPPTAAKGKQKSVHHITVRSRRLNNFDDDDDDNTATNNEDNDDDEGASHPDDTVGSLLAEIATVLADALRMLMFADKRHWESDEFEQVRALEDALDEAKADFQELGPLLKGSFYYESDRRRTSNLIFFPLYRSLSSVPRRHGPVEGGLPASCRLGSGIPHGPLAVPRLQLPED